MPTVHPTSLRRAEDTARRLPRRAPTPGGRRPSPPPARSATAEQFRRASDRALRGVVAEMARAGRLH